MKKCFTLLFSFIAFSLTLHAQSGKVHLISLADQYMDVYAIGLSPDGNRIAGYAGVQYYSINWTKSGGIRKLDEWIGNSGTFAVSNNGISVGQFPDSTYMYESYGNMYALFSAGYFDGKKWNSLGIMEDVEPADGKGSLAEAISADGKKVGGSRFTFAEDGKEILSPTIWTIGSSVTAQELEFTPTGQGARVMALSGDGSIAGGFASPYGSRNPVIWINGKIKDITLNGLVLDGEVSSISENGKYAALSIDGKAAIYDIEEDRLTVIGKKEGTMSAAATGVSNNGIVVGYNQLGLAMDREGFIYTEQFGMKVLTEYLAELNIATPKGLQMQTPMCLSADGSKIAGFGYNGAGEEMYMASYYVEIPFHLSGMNPPRELKVEEKEYGSIRLEWNAPAADDGNTFRGYNIYRNGEKLNTRIIKDTFYEDTSLENNVYSYKVTSVWNMEDESMPTEEMKLATAQLSIPFLEEFNSHDLEDNFWHVTNSNNPRWQVQDYSGIQAPAGIYYNPVNCVYEESMTTPFINASSASKVFLSFNVLMPTDMSKDDHLRVEVYDGNKWNTIDSYDPDILNPYAFVPKVYDISTYAANRVIKVRFTAYGDNKGAYLSWGIDNVNIYSSKDALSLDVPALVNAYRDKDGTVRLIWADPNEVADLSFLPNDYVDQLLGDEGKPFIVANKFEVNDLQGFQGFLLTEISAYLAWRNYLIPEPKQARFNLVVIQGGKKIMTQAVEEYTPNAWNTFKLLRPVRIDNAKPLYFGVEVVEHDERDWPIGLGDGGMIQTETGQLNPNDGRSNLFSEDGGVTWQKLTDTGIFAYGYSMAIKGKLSRKIDSQPKERILGYRIYRNGEDLLGWDPMGNLYLTSMGTYTDLNAPEGQVCYGISVFYTTQEESGQAMACVDGTVVSNETPDENVKVYSQNHSLHIYTAQPVSVRVYTMQGQLHTNRNIEAGDTVIRLPIGIYLVNVADKTYKIVITE